MLSSKSNGVKSDQLSIVNDSDLAQLQDAPPTDQSQINIDAGRLTLGTVLRLNEGETFFNARVTAIQRHEPPQGERIIRNCHILPFPHLDISVKDRQTPIPCAPASTSIPVQPPSAPPPLCVADNRKNPNQAVTGSPKAAARYPKSPPGLTKQHAPEHPVDSDQPAAQTVSQTLFPTHPELVGPGYTVNYRHSIRVDGSKRYIKGGILGGGSSGNVYLVLNTKALKQYAMKVIDFSRPFHVMHGRDLRREVMIHYQVEGSAFLLNMVDMWYSSAGFFHILTVECSLTQSYRTS